MCRKWDCASFSRFEEDGAEIEALKVAKTHLLFDFASHPGAGAGAAAVGFVALCSGVCAARAPKAAAGDGPITLEGAYTHVVADAAAADRFRARVAAADGA